MALQGGIASVLDSNDSVDNHIRDTIVAGAFLSDEQAVEVRKARPDQSPRSTICVGSLISSLEATVLVSRCVLLLIRFDPFFRLDVRAAFSVRGRPSLCERSHFGVMAPLVSKKSEFLIKVGCLSFYGWGC